MAFKNLSEALLVDLIVSVLPYLNHLVAPLSYIALVLLYNLYTNKTMGWISKVHCHAYFNNYASSLINTQSSMTVVQLSMSTLFKIDGSCIAY